MQDNTNMQYDAAVENCREIFIKKALDYGISWRVYRIISVADQIFIKAKRIRTIQEKGIQRISDDLLDEFKGILNYAIIGLIQLEFTNEDQELPIKTVESLYNSKISAAKKLMQDKNHDYGEAWRDMSQESFADLILAKILRIKQIIRNDGKTLMSEGIDANLFDIINYSVFALILAGEKKQLS
ncbi:DUF1599 domain-containing protein [soil metagenome]